MNARTPMNLRTIVLVGSLAGVIAGLTIGPSRPLGAGALVLGGVGVLFLLWSRGAQRPASATRPTTSADVWKAMDAGLDPTDDGSAPRLVRDSLAPDDSRSVIPPPQETR